MESNQKELVNNLKVEWKRLWLERLDDKVRAEGVAVKDYSALFVDRGLIVHATRDCKPLNFKEILEKHQVENTERYISPSPTMGGWGKFVKTSIIPQKSKRTVKCAASYCEQGKVKQQPKKSGRGWLHK